MSQHDPHQPDAPDAPRVDESGRPVDAVGKHLEQPNPATEKIDKLITPTSIKAREQEAEEIRRKSEQVRRQALDD
jgi:hypothetical protein